MGDHRASIKIEVEFHGFKDKCDMWINYCDSDGNGVDERITEFFHNMYNQGMINYNKEIDKYCKNQRKSQQEEEDKKEYKRLKAKYEQDTLKEGKGFV